MTTTTQPHRIFVVDDHPIILDGVRLVVQEDPNLEWVGGASDGNDAIRQLRRLYPHPDLIILDLKLPGMSPLDVIVRARQAAPDTKVLVMSAFDDIEYIRQLQKLGIEGYILKDEAPELLVNALHTVLQGATWFSSKIFQKMAGLYQEEKSQDDNLWSTLATREQELLMGIGKGWSNKQIAQRLHLAEQTVRNYTSLLYEKLGLNSRAQAVIWMRERGLTWEETGD